MRALFTCVMPSYVSFLCSVAPGGLPAFAPCLPGLLAVPFMSVSALVRCFSSLAGYFPLFFRIHGGKSPVRCTGSLSRCGGRTFGHSLSLSVAVLVFPVALPVFRLVLLIFHVLVAVVLCHSYWFYVLLSPGPAKAVPVADQVTRSAHCRLYIFLQQESLID